MSVRQYPARARRRLREVEAYAPASEKLCSELLRHFQAAIHGMDVPGMATLLGDEHPVPVRAMPLFGLHAETCANDAAHGVALAA